MWALSFSHGSGTLPQNAVWGSPAPQTPPSPYRPRNKVKLYAPTRHGSAPCGSVWGSPAALRGTEAHPGSAVWGSPAALRGTEAHTQKVRREGWPGNPRGPPFIASERVGPRAIPARPPPAPFSAVRPETPTPAGLPQDPSLGGVLPGTQQGAGLPQDPYMGCAS
jgi:hypothetical protein